MKSVRQNNLSLKCQRFSSLDCKDIGIRQFEFVIKTQFLCSEHSLGSVFKETPYHDEIQFIFIYYHSATQSQ